MINNATQVWLAFDMENRGHTLLKRMAARAIAKYCWQAVRSGVALADLWRWPAVFNDPAYRIAERFGLCDFTGCLLRAYYEDKKINAK